MIDSNWYNHWYSLNSQGDNRTKSSVDWTTIERISSEIDLCWIKWQEISLILIATILCYVQHLLQYLQSMVKANEIMTEKLHEPYHANHNPFFYKNCHWP
ncbi:hypothetical protein WUBG_10180 [Wuchereria bancrofti]|uniref:Uncharacterized protein n=1 Tax=Wuchereria bancrofti TaxID=6293 RepID=J9AWG2_WUCBA|nr:hypothetical protein WUBG_10180 [Wuchereria bancrofti]VDM10434.1 unnamed protein product [Wuchereria bancrofti]